MKIELKKKQAEVVLACLEEILASPYWTNEETFDAFVGKSREGEDEIYQISCYLQEKYGLETSSECFDRIFVDMEVTPKEKK
jgi:hypothetical protein